MPININKRQLTKDQILNAFWSIYKTTTIEKITVKAITQQAQINRSTFYEYFDDVYNVLADLENNLLPNLPEIAVKGDIRACMQEYESKKEYFKILLGQNGDPAFTFRLQDQLCDHFAAFLGHAVKSDRNLLFRLQFAAAGFVGVMQRYFEDDNQLTSEQLVQLLQELVLSGLQVKWTNNGQVLPDK